MLHTRDGLETEDPSCLLGEHSELLPQLCALEWRHQLGSDITFFQAALLHHWCGHTAGSV